MQADGEGGVEPATMNLMPRRLLSGPSRGFVVLSDIFTFLQRYSGKVFDFRRSILKNQKKRVVKRREGVAEIYIDWGTSTVLIDEFDILKRRGNSNSVNLG